MNATVTVSTWNFMHLGGEYADPLGVIDTIRSLGFAPELWLNWDGRPDWADRPRWDGLRERIGPCPNLSCHSRNDRGRLLEEIELLGHLGGRVLVVHPVALSEPAHRDERPAAHPDLPFIRDLAGAARARGVFLGLENIFGREFLDRTLGGVETFDGRGGLGICIDLGHAEMRRPDPGQSPEELIHDFGPVLLHLHVHDVVEGVDHRPLGAGCMNYATIAAALRDADYDGTAALEIQDYDPAATIRGAWALLSALLGKHLTR